MQWLQSTYTQRFNARHKVWGHLFQGRYKALPIEEGDYFRTVADYIHLNPARAHCFDLNEGQLTDYQWSSFCGYMQPSKRPSFLVVDRVLGNHELLDDQSGRMKYNRYMKKRVLEIAHSDNPKEVDEQWRKIRRGWAFGSEEFCLKIQDVLDEAVSGKRRDSFLGEEIRLHDEKEAEVLCQYGMKVCGLVEEELAELKKGDDRKRVVAWLIRKKTSVRVEWITTRLQMGRPSNFSYHIRQVETAKEGLLWELKTKIMI
jgi:hypothetical protein